MALVLEDAETGEQLVIDQRTRHSRARFEEAGRKVQKSTSPGVQRSGVEASHVSTDRLREIVTMATRQSQALTVTFLWALDVVCSWCPAIARVRLPGHRTASPATAKPGGHAAHGSTGRERASPICPPRLALARAGCLVVALARQHRWSCRCPRSGARVIVRAFEYAPAAWPPDNLLPTPAERGQDRPPGRLCVERQPPRRRHRGREAFSDGALCQAPTTNPTRGARRLGGSMRSGARRSARGIGAALVAISAAEDPRTRAQPPVAGSTQEPDFSWRPATSTRPRSSSFLLRRVRRRPPPHRGCPGGHGPAVANPRPMRTAGGATLKLEGLGTRAR